MDKGPPEVREPLLNTKVLALRAGAEPDQLLCCSRCHEGGRHGVGSSSKAQAGLALSRLGLDPFL